MSWVKRAPICETIRKTYSPTYLLDILRQSNKLACLCEPDGVGVGASVGLFLFYWQKTRQSSVALRLGGNSRDSGTSLAASPLFTQIYDRGDSASTDGTIVDNVYLRISAS
jgi:hypothetical protein